MNKGEYEASKAKFLKLFASVPLPLRNEIVAVVDNQPVSWSAAYGEIQQNADKAQIILTHLKQIGLL